MIIVDANLLIYATNRRMPQHLAALEWLQKCFDENTRIGLPWPTLLAFLRITSKKDIFGHSLELADCFRIMEGWLQEDNVWIPSPTDRHAEILARLVKLDGLKPDHVPDAHLAALAIEHGLTLCSTDTDFARFPGLKWENPLKPKG